MQRKILIPIEPDVSPKTTMSEKKNEDEFYTGLMLAVVIWTNVMSRLSFDPVQFIIEIVKSEVAKSSIIVNIFALIGIVFTVQFLPWKELFEQLCRLHLRLILVFPCVVLLSVIKCLIDIVHSYWCVFAPHSTLANPEYKLLEHPMERK